MPGQSKISAIQQSSMSAVDLKDKDQKDAEQGQQLRGRFESKDCGWGRILSYYQPCSASVAMVILALLNSF